MKQKMTQEQFTEILNSFGNKNKEHLSDMGVRLVANDGLSSDYLSEIPHYMKASLCRKVLRYVAKTALRGTFELDGLAMFCSFCEMEYGDPVSFASDEEWSFNYKGHLINVKIEKHEVYYYDKSFKEIWHTEIPYGVHWTQTSGKTDLVRMFEDYCLNRMR